MTDTNLITKATEIKKRILEGSELWYIANRQYKGMPGSWEMRYRHETIQVQWCAIERLRRDLSWCKANTEEIQVGMDWVYMPLTKDMFATSRRAT